MGTSKFKTFSRQVQQGRVNTISVTTDIGTQTFSFNSISDLAKQLVNRTDGTYTVGALFSHSIFHSPTLIK